ncbi:hypothetical protein AGR4B_pAt20536 [Agrobacterium tumefaciens str. CFBP 5621]|nr:hypothetical protein AGR4B_pAt20536 [Agrobacterium tumefaciens str. CFBP 5621]
MRSAVATMFEEVSLLLMRPDVFPGGVVIGRRRKPVVRVKDRAYPIRRRKQLARTGYAGDAPRLATV